MLFKLPINFTYARHKTEKVAKPLSLKQKIKADRIVMLVLLLIAITAAVIFA